MRSDGQEGFIPSGFVYPADNILQSNGKSTTNQTAYNSMTNPQSDVRQLQQQDPQADINANNETNCQSHNLQLGQTAIGHIPMQNGNDSQMTIINGTSNTEANSGGNTQAQSPGGQQQQTMAGASEDLRYHGTELVMLYDYKVRQNLIISSIHRFACNQYQINKFYIHSRFYFDSHFF